MLRVFSQNPARLNWLPLMTAALCFGASFGVLTIVGTAPMTAWLARLPETIASAVLSIAAGLIGAVIAVFATRRALRRHGRLLMDVVDNMSQALSVIDSNRRLMFYNKRFVAYCNLPADRLWSGRSLRDVLEERRQVGTFQGDPEAYIADSEHRVRTGVLEPIIYQHGDKVLSGRVRPMPGGNQWIATIEDITEQRKAEQQRASMAEQDQRRATVDGAIESFRKQVERMLKTVTDNAATMRATATGLSASSHQASERVEGAVQASNEASVNVESAAYAANELSSSIAEISRQLSQTNDVVRNAATEAQTTNSEIGGLATAAQKIGDVVKMIQDIAGQTNLLALNATIEAARAGDAGRGFAVVASEVKSLAVQTARATEEISGQIAAVQGSSTQVVDAIRLLTDRMQEINHYSSAVAASLHQQSAATGEITQNVANAAKGTRDVASTLGEVAGAASETRQSAQTVLKASEAVESAAESLRAEVVSFLQKVAL